ncbi:MAG TPA: uroporphyrinogen-III C-methyltransferase [Blastocatellia bacterium]|nr:uroporphyrinogen-III C-methyltransferase [Blastocatellia bacterium]
MKKAAGKVYLIGAGPGDPKLLTIKAAEALAASDAIVYDFLVNPEVLAHTRRGAELVFAGKRAGETSLSQREINQILIDRARGGQIVARLKGGDPFIFGRGGEEAEALADAGIEWEVIPGISSGVAAAAYAGIPLTFRDYSSSVAFFSGHDGVGKLRPATDWRAAGRAADTLVIFMCAGTISRIARELIAGGRPGATPLVLVRWGTYEYQEVYSGTLEDIAAFDRDDAPVDPPAIAIVGDVVSLRGKLHWFGRRELEFQLQAQPIAAAVRA